MPEYWQGTGAVLQPKHTADVTNESAPAANPDCKWNCDPESEFAGRRDVVAEMFHRGGSAATHARI